jgi:nitrogen fixation/metabolism regulation signal transduction histidine kinase
MLAQKQKARDRAVGVLLVAVGCLVAATFVLSHWLSRRLTRPVETLVDGTREIARGNLDYRVVEPSAPEFAQLARAFNHMAFELRQQQDALRRMEKAQAWQEVAQKLAHELKNPLTPIQLAAQRLRRRYDTNREGFDQLLDQCTDVIQRQVASLSTLLDEFSRLARLPEPNLAPVPLSDVLTSVINLFPELDGDAETGTKFIRVERNLPDDLPPLLADAEQMQRVFHNLVKNAVEAMPTGGTLSVTARRSDDDAAFVEVWVDDTGTGIATNVRERLFLPHVSTKPDGHGLGLAIVRKIVEDHRGRIALEPKPDGVGTRVSLRLLAMTSVERTEGV